MHNLNEPKNFNLLKEFFILAIHQPMMLGKKKMYNLSISLNGNEIKVKRSSKKIKHTSFHKVILGAVLRMKKLFDSEKLDLEVILRKAPNPFDLTLEFELINKKIFSIGEEEYFISIVAKYSYSKMGFVTYFPIIYRQTCSNGAVAVISEKFKETITVDKILDINCEWSKCNFESYKIKTDNYFEYLRRCDIDAKKLETISRSLINKVLNLKTKPNKKSIINTSNLEDFSLDNSISSLSRKYQKSIGNNQFAAFNILTEFASKEESFELRDHYFNLIGKYLAREVKKTADFNKQMWAESLNWDDINKFTK